MGFTDLNKMFVLSDNFIHTYGVTWSKVNFTEVTNHPMTNLNNLSASSLLKGVSASSNPSVTAQFTVARPVVAFGLCNHNLGSAGYTGIRLYYSDNGADFTRIGTTDLAVTDNRDVIALFTDYNHAWYRFELRGGTGDFRIGYAYWGSAYEFDVNPTDGAFIQIRYPNMQFVETAGGGVFAREVSEYSRGELSISYPRSTGDDTDFWNGIKNKVVGVVPPEYAPGAHLGPNGQDFFFGYVLSVTQSVRSPGSIANSTNRYDVSVNMRGAL